jgi:hypothetical protein
LTITETVLIFVCIPLAVILLVFGLVYGTGAARNRRYRPGRPFASAPVWYLAEDRPDRLPSSVPALTGASGESELSAELQRSSELQRQGEVGGASDSW